MLAEATRVPRYPRFQALHGLSDADLLDYIQFLQSISHLVVPDPQYRAPLRDPNDLIVLQTAERGEADILCTGDGDFYDPIILSYCAARGIEVCDESTLLERLARVNQRSALTVRACDLISKIMGGGVKAATEIADSTYRKRNAALSHPAREGNARLSLGTLRGRSDGSARRRQAI